MRKEKILDLIIEKLNDDLEILSQAALSAHEAATNSENIPDNKYDTLSLEASYVAQGQANRANAIKVSLLSFQQMSLEIFNEGSPIYNSALVKLEDEEENQKTVFIGSQAGGLKIHVDGEEIIVITPESPLGKGLIGKLAGDIVELRNSSVSKEGRLKKLEILEVS